MNNTGYSSIKIFCESKNANTSIASSRKIWTLQSPIVLGNTSNIKMLVSVESCSIPLSFYMVNETNFNFSFNGAKGKIQAGNYNATKLTAYLNEVQQNFTFFFNKDLSKFMIKGKMGPNTIDRIDNSIYSFLGIGSQASWTDDDYFIPSGVCNLVYTSGIYISLNDMSNANIDTGTSQQSSTCLLRIPISQPVNTYLQHFNNVGFKTMLSGSVLNQLDISLLDDNRNLLQLSDNVPWVIVLRIDFEKTIVEVEAPTKINKLRTHF